MVVGDIINYIQLISSHRQFCNIAVYVPSEFDTLYEYYCTLRVNLKKWLEPGIGGTVLKRGK